MAPPALLTSILPRWYLAALASFVIVGAVMRCWQTRESLWIDELHTAWCAAGKLADVAPRAVIGNQSPLFFWSEWLLVRLLGPSELTLRLPSVLAGSLVPLALFLLARRWSGSSGMGLLAAALVVVDPTSIFFATEARPYALVQLFAVVHVAITAELVERPSAWLRIAWIGVAALLFHLHYTAVLLIPAELAFWGLLYLNQSSSVRYHWSSLARDLGVFAVLCLPGLGNVLAIFARRENWAAVVPQRPLTEMFELLPWSISSLMVLAATVIEEAGRKGEEEDERGRRPLAIAILALCWLLVPVLLAWLATIADVARLFLPRYLAASAPAAMLLTALCAGLPPWRWARFSLGAAIIAAALWTSGITSQLRYDGRVIGERNEDWRGAAQWLNEQLTQQPYPVLVASGLIEADALRQPHDRLLEDYCLLPVTSLYELRAERADLIPLTYRDPGKLQPADLRLVVARGGGWLVVRGGKSRAEKLAGQVEKVLTGTGARGQEPGIRGQESGVRSQKDDWRVARRQSFGGVQVFLILDQRAGQTHLTTEP